MSTINKANIRRITAKKIADSFIASGKPFTSPASVYFSERKYAQSLAQELLDFGINLSRGTVKTSFSANMASMFMSDAIAMILEKKV